jgi:hypothetical protein
MPAAIETLEPVAAFASGIGQRNKRDGGVVKWASGLFVEEMDFGHHRDRSDIPRWSGLLYSRDLLLHMAPFTLRFIHFDATIVGSVIGDIHRPATSRLGAGQVFVL